MLVLEPVVVAQVSLLYLDLDIFMALVYSFFNSRLSVLIQETFSCRFRCLYKIR